MKKFLLTLLLLAATAVPAAAADFPDVPADAWYADEVAALVASGCIDGMPDGNFDPDGTMTMAQFIKLLSSFTLEVPEAEAGEAWHGPYVRAAEEAGLLEGLDCAPLLDEPLIRQDMAQLMYKAALYLGGTEPDCTLAQRRIADWEAIPQSRRNSVLGAFCMGLITGRTDGSFDGKASLRRSEACAVILRLTDESLRTPVPGYDFGAPAPEGRPVSDRELENSLFIGNSIGEGFRLYSGLKAGRHETAVGMTVYNAPNRVSAFAGRDRVYIMLGVNEIGGGIESICEKYSQLIDKLRAVNPSGDIYVQSLTPVCEEMLSSSQRGWGITNANIDAMNFALQKLCKEKRVFYLDIHSALETNGALERSRTWDGVHLTPEAYVLWAEYLKAHVV